MNVTNRVLWMTFLAAAVPFGHLIDNGYSPFNIEVVVISLGFAAVGAVLGYVFSNRWAYGLAFCLLLFVFLDVYIIPSKTVPLIAAIGICLALLLFFRKIESTAVPGLSVAAAVFSLAAILNPSTLPPDQPADPPSMTARTKPGIIHIFLDEFGSPTAIKNGMPEGHPGEDIVDQLVARGFFVHERAHSISANTIHSMGSIFGMTDQKGNVVKNPAGASLSFEVKENLLAQQIQEAGFSTKALQTDFLAICLENESAGCQTHTRKADMSVFTEMELRIADRLGLALLSMHHDYILKKSVRRVWLYRIVARTVFGHLQDYKFFSTPAVAVKLLEKLETEVPDHPTGTVSFYHFLVPHYPFILDEACKLKPVSQWRYPPRNEVRGATDVQVYAGHWDQAACVGALILKIADAAHDGNDPIFVIHGDHGNRLMAGTPKQNDAEQFSTFLAIRAPGLEAGRSATAVKLNEKIREFYEGFLQNR